MDSFSDDCSTASIGDYGYCACNSNCAENEGDCDSNNECQNGQVCGTNNCPVSLGFYFEVDCCYTPTLGDEIFCTSDNPCNENEGDCDSVAECQNGLFCGSNNCPAVVWY